MAQLEHFIKKNICNNHSHQQYQYVIHVLLLIVKGAVSIYRSMMLTKMCLYYFSDDINLVSRLPYFRPSPIVPLLFELHLISFRGINIYSIMFVFYFNCINELPTIPKSCQNLILQLKHNKSRSVPNSKTVSIFYEDLMVTLLFFKGDILASH